MTRPVTAAGLALIAASLAAGAVAPDDAGETAGHALSPAELLGAAAHGDFARAALPYPFDFPADHGSHDAYRTETWQLSGVLDAGDGVALGLQLIVIRIALGSRPARDRPPGWDTGEIYAALFSISNPDGARLHSARRLVRGGIGLAGWQAAPLRLWVEDWSVEQAVGGDPARLELRLAAPGMRLELALAGRQPPVDHNRIRGSDRGAAPPFVYYVEPRLAASGRLVDGARTRALTGTVSIEHAWGELPLPGGPVAQDRFNLYLADGRELFLLRSHRADGTGSATTAGLMLLADRRPLLLDGEAIELEARDYWRSPDSGARYPLRWRLRVPSQQIDLELVAEREREEGNIWSPFWSGPVRLQPATGPAAGEGLMQLSGYLEP